MELWHFKDLAPKQWPKRRRPKLCFGVLWVGCCSRVIFHKLWRPTNPGGALLIYVGPRGLLSAHVPCGLIMPSGEAVAGTAHYFWWH
uniref:Uncharacterized protein n=1 Tax=Globodera rostochiensis TaxID=31243 RepID=A0A914HSJ2_GLORO